MAKRSFLSQRECDNLEKFIGRYVFCLADDGLEVIPIGSKFDMAKFKRENGTLLRDIFYGLCTGDFLVQKVGEKNIRTITPSDWEGRDDTKSVVMNILDIRFGEPFYLVDNSETEGDILKKPRFIGIVGKDGVSIYPIKLYFPNTVLSNIAFADWMLDEEGKTDPEERDKYWTAITRGYVSVCKEFHEEDGLILNPASLDFENEDVEDMIEEEQGEEFLRNELKAQAEKEEKRTEKEKKRQERIKQKKK